MKGVMAIPKSKIILKEMLVNVFKTHPDLDADDINYIVLLIMNLNLNDNTLAKFITQTYKILNTGRYSLYFNTKLENNIKRRCGKDIAEQIKNSGTEVSWPELYCNDLLNDDEIDIVDSIAKREFSVILYTIEKSKTSNCSVVFPTFNNNHQTNNNQISQDLDGIYYNSLYSKCYNEVCIAESKQKGKIVSFDESKIPQVAYVSDDNNHDTTKNKNFCFNTMYLISRLSKENYINPETKLPFTTRTLCQLMAKYQIEIKMYKKFLLLINK